MKDVIFAACDNSYFELHGKEFLHSSIDNGNNTSIHVINPSKETEDFLAQWKERRTTVTIQF